MNNKNYEVTFTINGEQKWKASFGKLENAIAFFDKEEAKLPKDKIESVSMGVTSVEREVKLSDDGGVLKLGVEPEVDTFWENIKKELGLN